MDANIAQITVKGMNLAQYITVRTYHEGELEYCNHAGAETEEFVEYTGYGENTREHVVHGLECDKCKAQNFAGEWIES